MTINYVRPLIDRWKVKIYLTFKSLSQTKFLELKTFRMISGAFEWGACRSFSKCSQLSHVRVVPVILNLAISLKWYFTFEDKSMGLWSQLMTHIRHQLWIRHLFTVSRVGIMLYSDNNFLGKTGFRVVMY